jgi:hypothetical protein
MPHYKAKVELELDAINEDEARSKLSYELDKQFYPYDIDKVSEKGSAPTDFYVDPEHDGNPHFGEMGSEAREDFNPEHPDK